VEQLDATASQVAGSARSLTRIADELQRLVARFAI
jgi:methyl-accepting chemotaxis protein